VVERLNLIVEDGVKELLVELAGGERKIGAYISSLVLDTYELSRQPSNSVQRNEVARVLDELRRRVISLQKVIEEDIVTLQGVSILKLHEAMANVLTEFGPMHARDIAAEVNKRALYSKRDGSKVESSQISARANKYPELFVRLDDGRLGLVTATVKR
jgi:hypothetical protein